MPHCRNDTIYGEEFRHRVAGMQIEEVPTATQARPNHSSVSGSCLVIRMIGEQNRRFGQ